MSNEFYEWNHQDNYQDRENAKKLFENSIASLGDLYGNQFSEKNYYNGDDIKRRFEIEHQMKSSPSARKNSTHKNKSPKINNVFLGLETGIKSANDTHNKTKYSKNNENLGSDGEHIYVTFLKSGKIQESKKYQHVKSGKINPPKSNYSIKSGIEKKIKDHEENMKKVVLYASPVKIQAFKSEAKRSLSPIRRNAENYYNDAIDDNSHNIVVVGGGAQESQANQNFATTNRYNNYVNRTQNLNSSQSPRENASQSYVKSNKSPKTNKNNNKAIIEKQGTREERELQKKYENLYSYTKDFFTSNAIKVPSKGTIDDIIHHAQDMEKSLLNYKKTLDENKTKQRPFSNFPKDSMVKYRNKIKPKPPKVYLEIDPEIRKKIEERLQSLHLEIRTTFDNLNQIGDKDGKIHELINKCNLLSNMLKGFAQNIKGSSNFNQVDNNQINQFGSTYNSQNFNNSMKQTFPYNQTQTDNAGFQMNNELMSSNTNFYTSIGNNYINPNSSVIVNKNDVDEVIDVLKETNMSRDINKDILNFQGIKNIGSVSNRDINYNNTLQNNHSFNNFPQNNRKNENLNNNYQKDNLNLQQAVTQYSSLNSPTPQHEINHAHVQQPGTQNNQYQYNSNPNAQFNHSKFQVPTNYKAQDKTIEMLKSNMSNLHYDDNKMFFESGMNFSSNNFNPNIKQSEDFVNTNSVNFRNSQLKYNPSGQNFTNNFSPQHPDYNQSNYDQNGNDKSYMNNQSSYQQNQQINNYSFQGINKDANAKTNHYANYNAGNNNLNLMNEVNSKTNIQSNNNITNLNMNTSIQVNENLNEKYPKLNTKNVTRDDRFTAYDIEMPIDYYYNISKSNEPTKDKDWYIRAHHTETFSKSPNAIADDILNTKYISYYGKVDKPEKEKTREEKLDEIIINLEQNREKLQIELLKKATIDKDFGKIYNNLEQLKAVAKKEFESSKLDSKKYPDSKESKIGGYLGNNSKAAYSEMYNQNDDIQQTNLAIGGYATVLDELRNNEKNLINNKRKEEYEKLRPPVDRWWEIKDGKFKEELQRNKVIINASSEYFKKLDELQNENLY